MISFPKQSPKMSDTAFNRLSYLGFQHILPSPMLRPYVQSYWYIHTESPVLQDNEEFWHPGGNTGLVFNLGNSFQINNVPIHAHSFLDGATTTSRRLNFYGNIKAIGIRFRVGGAFPFLATPLHEFTDEIIGLDDLRIVRREIYEQVCEVPTLTQKVDVIEAWLFSRLKGDCVPISPIGESLTLIKRSAGQASIKQIADRVYLSQRQLERLFKDQVGISPKKYAQLLRVDHARNALKHIQHDSVADVGHLTGFYDQSHFIREFKAVVGMTPKQYMKRNLQRSLQFESIDQRPK